MHGIYEVTFYINRQESRQESVRGVDSYYVWSSGMWPGWGTGIQGPSMLAIIWFQLGLLVNKSKGGKQGTDKGGKVLKL